MAVPQQPAAAPDATEHNTAWPGSDAPLGATWDGEGTNFAIFSETAEAVELVLYDAGGEETATYALVERTDLVWHGYVDTLAPGRARSVVVDRAFPWGEGPRPPTHWADTIIYEVHGKGFTKLHPEVPEP